MPTEPNSNNESFYDRVFSIFRKNPSDKSAQGRRSRFQIGFKSSLTYEDDLQQLPSGIYGVSAGSDLSAIFIPYSTAIKAANPDMPAFHQDVDPNATVPSGGGPSIYTLMPFKWKISDSDGYYNKSLVPSGDFDSIGGLISGPFYPGSTEKFRNIGNTRAIGIRLPLVGVGWGYSADGSGPVPSGIGSGVWEGEYSKGYQVDPANYIAAPIDFRYNSSRHVWVSGAEAGFWAEVMGVIIPSGILPSGVTGSGILAYQWQERSVGPSGVLIPVKNNKGRKGGYNGKDYAFEANYNRGVASGTKVWMQLKEGDNLFYEFDCGLTKEFDCDRWFFDKMGHEWNNDGPEWKTGQYYSKDQYVLSYGDGKYYKANADHFSDISNQPSGGGGPWDIRSTPFKGVKIKTILLGRPNDDNNCFQEYEAHMYFDSHGHLAGIREEDPCGSGIPDCPRGQYQEMVHKMVTQNSDGYDYIRAHATIV